MSNQDYSHFEIGVALRAARETAVQKVPAIVRCAVLTSLISLAACAADITKHGHIFQEEDIAQIKPGMTRDQVVLALGTPDTKSTVGQDAYYYISTTTKRSAAFLNPTITDRKVVAVYFDKKDAVARVGHYGLQDGRVINFSKQETPSKGSEDGLLKELFRNIGRPTGAVNQDSGY